MKQIIFLSDKKTKKNCSSLPIRNLPPLPENRDVTVKIAFLPAFFGRNGDWNFRYQTSAARANGYSRDREPVHRCTERRDRVGFSTFRRRRVHDVPPTGVSLPDTRVVVGGGGGVDYHRAPVRFSLTVRVARVSRAVGSTRHRCRGTGTRRQATYLQNAVFCIECYVSFRRQDRHPFVFWSTNRRQTKSRSSEVGRNQVVSTPHVY